MSAPWLVGLSFFFPLHMNLCFTGLKENMSYQKTLGPRLWVMGFFFFFFQTKKCHYFSCFCTKKNTLSKCLYMYIDVENIDGDQNFECICTFICSYFPCKSQKTIFKWHLNCSLLGHHFVILNSISLTLMIW